MGTVLIYHDNCHDGVTAAAIFSMHYRDTGRELELYPAKYDEPPALERLLGKDVIVCDFSWKLPQMEEVREHAVTLVVLDHHKTAEVELAGLVIECGFGAVHFDLNRSGAGMAWDYCHPGKPRPEFVTLVEDRDLWRFSRSETKAFHAACSSYPLTVEERERLLVERTVGGLVSEGEAILRYHNQLVESAVKYRPRETIGGHSVPSIPCPTPQIISDVGHILCYGEKFSATYGTKDDGSRMYSLRSDDNGLDVSEIAKSYGGGGHKHAAGFTLQKGQLL